VGGQGAPVHAAGSRERPPFHRRGSRERHASCFSTSRALRLQPIELGKRQLKRRRYFEAIAVSARTSFKKTLRRSSVRPGVCANIVILVRLSLHGAGAFSAGSAASGPGPDRRTADQCGPSVEPRSRVILRVAWRSLRRHAEPALIEIGVRRLAAEAAQLQAA
jgi:hypothetical protein